MQISYTLSFDEYRRANRLWLQHGLRKPAYRARTTSWAGPAIGIVFWAAGIFLALAGPAYRAATVAMFAIGGAAISLPITHARNVRRLYKLQELATRAVTASFNEDGVQISRDDGKADTRWAWT